MIAVIDYGAGNLFSVCNALEYLGLPHQLTKNPTDLRAADGLILPGVGAFPAGMQMLNESGLAAVIREEAKKKPLLGICLGMQMLLEESDEVAPCKGLGLIKGSVHRIPSQKVIIPHMGWNELAVLQADCPLLKGLEQPLYTYFVHSYQAFCDDANIVAYAEYDGKIPALITDGGYVFGAQFHPEKSGEQGLQMLRNFGGMLSC